MRVFRLRRTVKFSISIGIRAAAVVLLVSVSTQIAGQTTPLDQGIELFLKDEMEAARPFLETAVLQNPRDERLYLYLATVYENTGDSVRAVDILQQGVRYASEYLDVMYFNIGNNLYKQDKNILALEMFSKAIDLNPSLSDAYLNRANSALRLEQFESAVRDYKLFLQLRPNDSQKDQIEEVIRIITSIVDAQRQKAFEDERVEREEEARKQALLDQVRNSLQNASRDTTNLSAETGEVERADEDSDIVE